MAKAKSKSQAPNFLGFVQAAICDPALARRMVAEKRNWLTMTNDVGETALAYVVIENHLEAAKLLLDCGADVITHDMSDETPLIQASGLGYGEMVTLLLERGAEVDARNQYQETALFKAVRYGHSEICAALLAAGAEVNVQSDMEERLDNVVLPRKRAQVMSVLLRHGYREPAEH